MTGDSEAGAPGVSTLSIDHVRRLCLEQQDKASWPHGAGSYELVDTWTSRTARFYRLRGAPEGSPDVVAKVPDATRPASLASWDAALHELRTILSSDGATTRVPLSLGYTADPAILWMTHVPGRDAASLASDPSIASEELRSLLGTIAARAGETLGAFHSRTERGFVDGSDARTLRRSAFIHARKLAILAGHRTETIDSLWPQVVIAPRYGDFGIYNFRITDGGQCYLVDPADSTAFGPVHRDVAWFLFGMDALLVRRVQPRLGERRTVNLQAELRDRFIVGYSESGSTRFDADGHAYLVSLYEYQLAIRKLRKRLLQGRFSNVAYYGRVMLRKRRSAASLAEH